MNNRNRFDELWEENPVARIWMIIGFVIVAVTIAALLGGIFDQWIYHIIQ